MCRLSAARRLATPIRTFRTGGHADQPDRDQRSPSTSQWAALRSPSCVGESRSSSSADGLPTGADRQPGRDRLLGVAGRRRDPAYDAVSGNGVPTPPGGEKIATCGSASWRESLGSSPTPWRAYFGSWRARFEPGRRTNRSRPVMTITSTRRRRTAALGVCPDASVARRLPAPMTIRSPTTPTTRW